MAKAKKVATKKKAAAKKQPLAQAEAPQAPAPNFEYTFVRNGISVKQLDINGTIINNPPDNDKIAAATDDPFFVTALATKNSPGGGGNLQINFIPKGKNIWPAPKDFDFSAGANGSISESNIQLP